MGSPRWVPDFAKIPREQWKATMRTIPVGLREPAVQGLALPLEQLAELAELAACADLPPTRSDLIREAILANPRLAPVPFRRRGRIADRQVSFRVTDEEYLDLATAAELAGTSPSRLAAMLVSNGVRRVLEEANRLDG